MLELESILLPHCSVASKFSQWASLGWGGDSQPILLQKDLTALLSQTLHRLLDLPQVPELEKARLQQMTLWTWTFSLISQSNCPQDLHCPQGLAQWENINWDLKLGRREAYPKSLSPEDCFAERTCSFAVLPDTCSLAIQLSNCSWSDRQATTHCRCSHQECLTPASRCETAEKGTLFMRCRSYLPSLPSLSKFALSWNIWIEISNYSHYSSCREVFLELLVGLEVLILKGKTFTFCAGWQCRFAGWAGCTVDSTL